jgi:hypothetical protein
MRAGHNFHRATSILVEEESTPGYRLVGDGFNPQRVALLLAAMRQGASRQFRVLTPMPPRHRKREPERRTLDFPGVRDFVASKRFADRGTDQVSKSHNCRHRPYLLIKIDRENPQSKNFKSK